MPVWKNLDMISGREAMPLAIAPVADGSLMAEDKVPQVLIMESRASGENREWLSGLASRSLIFWPDIMPGSPDKNWFTMAIKGWKNSIEALVLDCFSSIFHLKSETIPPMLNRPP